MGLFPIPRAPSRRAEFGLDAKKFCEGLLGHEMILLFSVASRLPEWGPFDYDWREDEPPMGFYPAFLNLSGKECLVVGGGILALHKTADLHAAGAKVTVVSPRVAPAFFQWKDVRVVRRRFRVEDLSPAPWLVVAATDDEALHAEISALCRARRVWVNVVDRPPLCDFIVPAVVRRGPVTFAVSTGGLSPAMAKVLGAELRRTFGREVGRMAAVLKGLRTELLRLSLPDRRKVLKKLVTRPWINRFKSHPRVATEMFRATAQRLMKNSGRSRAKN